MATRRNATVVDLDGVRARIRDFTAGDHLSAKIVVELASGVRISLPSDLLHRHSDGGYSIEGRWRELAGAHTELQIPVPQEEVVVGVRTVPRERVRVRRRVVTEDQIVETPICRERLEIERVPRGDFVQQMPVARYEGDTLIIPLVEEIPVTETRLRVTEELRVRVIRERGVDRRTVPLRRVEIEIEHDKKDEGGSS